jgi:hypothetical protein
MSTVRQASFAGGQIDARLHGRTDLSRYGVSVKTCLNAVPTPLGPLMTRPGSEHCAVSHVATADTARQIPFVFSAGQSYVLEIGKKVVSGTISYIVAKVYYNGALLAATAVPPTPALYSASTTYEVGDVCKIAGEWTATAGWGAFTASGIDPPIDGSVKLKIGSPAEPSVGTINLQLSVDSGDTWYNAVELTVDSEFDLGTIDGDLTGVLITPTDGTWTAGNIYPWAQNEYLSIDENNVGHDPTTSTQWILFNGTTDIVLPWSLSADMTKLSWAQVGDVMTLCCQGESALEISRLTHTTWACAPVDFEPRPAYLPSIYDDGACLYPTAPFAEAHLDSKTYFTNDLVQYNNKTYKCIASGGWSKVAVPSTDPTNWELQDDSHTAREWIYYVTAVCQDASGKVWETAPFEVTKARCKKPVPISGHDSFALWDVDTVYVEGDRIATSLTTGSYRECLVGGSTGNYPPVSPANWGEELTSTVAVFYQTLPTLLAPAADRPIAVDWNNPGLLSDPGWTALYWRVFRGARNGYCGLVGETESMIFWDFGNAPDYTQQPPKGENPFAFESYTGVVTYEHPSCVTHYEQRRVFANTESRPASVLTSRTGDYDNFDKMNVATDSDPIEVELASAKFEEIRQIAPLAKMIIFGSEGEWSLSGGGAPLSYSSIDAKNHGSRGCGWLPPIVFDGGALWVQPRGPRVREIGYSSEAESFKSRDMAMLAADLLEGLTVVDWSFQREPHGIFWLVMSDGTMRSLTYDRDQEVIAWAKHSTLHGYYKAVCCIPEAAADSVYLSVTRSYDDGGNQVTSRRVERMTPTCCLDGAISYAGASATAMTGLGTLEGESVYALCGTSTLTVQGPYVVTSGAITLGVAATAAEIGLLVTEDLEPLEIGDGDSRHRVKNVVRCWLESVAGHGSVYAGETSSDLSVATRDSDGRVEIRIAETWNRPGWTFIRYADPRPLTLLAIAREVEFGNS